VAPATPSEDKTVPSYNHRVHDITGEANGKIGSLLLHQKKAMESVPYLREHAQISAETGSADGRCRACSALAIGIQ
jgi:hypothetical protein